MPQLFVALFRFVVRLLGGGSKSWDEPADTWDQPDSAWNEHAPSTIEEKD
jgi:hypothetical protein